MRRISENRRKLNAAAEQLREAFADEFRVCWVTGEPATDTHEMVRGADRPKAYGERCAWLRLSRRGHKLIHDNPLDWPIARQLALKLRWDGDFYDRQRVNVLRGRAVDAVTSEEVLVWKYSFDGFPVPIRL